MGPWAREGSIIGLWAYEFIRLFGPGRWVNATGPSWVDAVHGKGLRWDASWDADPAGALKAVQQWMASPPDQVLPCRSALRWPERRSFTVGMHVSFNKSLLSNSLLD